MRSEWGLGLGLGFRLLSSSFYGYTIDCASLLDWIGGKSCNFMLLGLHCACQFQIK